VTTSPHSPASSQAAGNDAFKAGNYDEAIAQFTKAIEADPTNHVLYSNRSGAHAAKESYTEALLDANKCIELKSDWPKGHSRRGAAYFGLKNWIQSQASYEKGLELDPASQVMKDELEKVKLKRNPAARAAAGGGMPGMPGMPSTPRPNTSLPARVLSLGALLCGAVYMLPILGAGRAHQAYQASIAQVLALFLVNLSKFPKAMSTLSDPAFRNTMEVQAFVLCIFMLLSPPMPFALMPFLTGALLNVVHGFQPQLQQLPEIIRSRVQYLITPEGAFQIAAFGAVSEVIVTFMGPLLVVVQGTRAMLMTFFYFQYLSRRYRTNEQTVQVVRLFEEKADGICKHRLVPAPLQAGYDRVKGLIRFASTKLN